VLARSLGFNKKMNSPLCCAVQRELGTGVPMARLLSARKLLSMLLPICCSSDAVYGLRRIGAAYAEPG